MWEVRFVCLLVPERHHPSILQLRCATWTRSLVRMSHFVILSWPCAIPPSCLPRCRRWVEIFPAPTPVQVQPVVWLPWPGKVLLQPLRPMSPNHLCRWRQVPSGDPKHSRTGLSRTRTHHHTHAHHIHTLAHWTVKHTFTHTRTYTHIHTYTRARMSLVFVFALL